MTALDELTITGWPAQPVPLPPYPRRRYRLDEDGRTLVGVVEDGPPVAADGETYLRLAEVDADDPDAVLAFANAVGTVGFSGGPESQPLGEFGFTVEVIRDAVTAWRLVQGEPTLGAPQWELPRFERASGDLDAMAIEFLNLMLATGLRPLELEVALGQASSPRELSLYSLCCLELHNHIVARSAYRSCANETCGRLFVPAGAGRRRDVIYCSRACARAQAQREFRRRRREQEDAPG